MSTRLPNRLPDAALIEFDSPAMSDLEFALTVLSLYRDDRLDEIDLHHKNGDTSEAVQWAINTLIALTRRPAA